MASLQEADLKWTGWATSVYLDWTGVRGHFEAWQQTTTEMNHPQCSQPLDPKMFKLQHQFN